MSKIQLFGSYTSPFVRHCRIIFAQNAVDYDFIDTDYTASGKGSPNQRVPYLHHGDLKLHDSSAIIQYLRQQSGQDYLAQPTDTEKFALANTVLDTVINLFLLEKSGINDNDNPFLQRQQSRINSGLAALDKLAQANPQLAAMTDADWRVACLLDWGLYRQRIDISAQPNLQSFLSVIRDWEVFQQTAPPAE